MKKILILVVMVFGLVACGEKFPYTSQRNKEKMIQEFQVAVDKAEKTKDDKDAQVAFEKMGEIIKIGNNSDLEKVNDEVELVELTEGLLQEARATIEKNKVLSVPISGLATLGTGVATLLPELNKLTGLMKHFID